MRKPFALLLSLMIVPLCLLAQPGNKALPRFWQESDGYLLYTASDPITGDLHKNHFDQVVFAKTRIDKNGGEDQLSTSFKLGDFIYGRVFMRTSLLNYKVYMRELSEEPAKNTDGYFIASLFIDGVQQEYSLITMSLSGGLETATTFTLIINGSGEDAEMNNEVFFQTLDGLSDGSHKIRIEIWGWQGQFFTAEPVATGEFTLIKEPGSKTVLGRTFDNVVAGMSDADLEAKILKKLNDHAKANGWEETFMQVKITSDDWYILRHELTGVVTGRSLGVSALAKWPDGHCSMQDFVIKQDHDGSAFQQSVQLMDIGTQTELDCSK
jgi:hypothetical protein